MSFTRVRILVFPASWLPCHPVRSLGLWILLLVGAVHAGAEAGERAPLEHILFVGNSFTYGHGAAVRRYRTHSVEDLNGESTGGVPALFKSFASQAGLSFDVFVETHPGVGLDWHIEHKLDVIGDRPWDVVVLQSYSTLDAQHPGDPAALIRDVHTLAAAVEARNPAVDVRLTATWPRADQVYPAGGAWHGRSIEAMTRDLRAGYAAAAEGTPGVKGVVPVGDAWLRAIHEGVADANPYDGIDAGRINLWTDDDYHASDYGYYLEALMLFGSITGRDPRWLGALECSAVELKLAPGTATALQRVAYEELAAQGVLAGARAPGTRPMHGRRVCP